MEKYSHIREEIRCEEKRGRIEECIKLCNKAIAQTDISNIDDWYCFRINLMRFLYIQEKSKNLEMIITIGSNMFEVLAFESHSKMWASLHRNLGFMYDQRIDGNKQENILTAINHYQESLRYFTRTKHPYDWAILKAGIGCAYSELESENEKLTISKAIKNYLDTLLVFTEVDYPDDHEDSIQELNSLKNKLDDDNLWDNLVKKTQEKAGASLPIFGSECMGQKSSQ